MERIPEWISYGFSVLCLSRKHIPVGIITPTGFLTCSLDGNRQNGCSRVPTCARLSQDLHSLCHFGTKKRKYELILFRIPFRYYSLPSNRLNTC